ncbi:MAG TPA: pyridoxamine 5'-phosphate oxidase family protein [Acidimicrobiales bacterium]|nr:pyridoxamine 5'-phosphate oxidase family protein [Acidimicrobiales bacterium]
MPSLTPAEVETFLDEPGHLVRIGTVDGDGHPKVVPTWFIRVEGRIMFTPRGTSAFLGNIRRDPRVGLSIDEEALPYRKVTVQGRAEVVHDVGRDDEWRDLYRRIAKRYVPPEAADAYVDDTIDQPRALIGVELATSRVTTWRMPVGDERQTGIWARRYYLPGTHMAGLADSGGGSGPYVAAP